MFKLHLEKAEKQRSNCQHLWTIENAGEFQKSIYFCYVDYTKAFDCVDHNKLWKILQEMGVPAPQFESISSLVLSLLCGPTLRPVHDYCKNHSFVYMDLCWQSDVSIFKLLSRFVMVPRASVF